MSTVVYPDVEKVDERFPIGGYANEYKTTNPRFEATKRCCSKILDQQRHCDRLNEKCLTLAFGWLPTIGQILLFKENGGRVFYSVLQSVLQEVYWLSSSLSQELYKSGRRVLVRSICCCFRHLAISPWLPDRNTSGICQPRNSGGRVYWG